MGNQLNNTSALTGALRPGYQSREVRKVNGGHIIRESSHGPDGQYSATERVVPAGERPSGPNHLAEAIKVAKGG